MLAAALAAAVAVAAARIGWCQSRPELPEPAIAVDDTRSHAPVLFEGYQLAVTYRYLLAGTRADLITAQVAIGPDDFEEMHVAAILGWLRGLSFRIRAAAAGTDMLHDPRFGPLTFAVQRYVFVEPLDIAPLVFLHAGVEVALSTPWLSGRQQAPGETLRTAMAVDTELASNGWSLRPAGAYVRADLLLCRSIYAELGAGPELFVPTLPGAPSEYGLRFHAAAGASLACVGKRDSWFKNLDVVLEYRGRARLYAGDQAPDIFSEGSIEIQHRGPLTVGLFASSDAHNYVGAGVRLALAGR